MQILISPDADRANAAAADWLSAALVAPGVRTFMVAAGNTPLELYRRVAGRGLDLRHLHVFVLDEYVGVPLDEPRNCANLLRDHVQRPWGIPDAQFHALSSLEQDALTDVARHEQRIESMGGLDLLILGLGQNGHIGFNEPGSGARDGGRLLDLEPISIEANRTWFRGVHAPAKGVTTGMATLLKARQTAVLAFGSHKTSAVRAMVEGPVGVHCPASWLRGAPSVRLYLDIPAAAGLTQSA
jgi:glucosamine-6-phosphate deaminase